MFGRKEIIGKILDQTPPAFYSKEEERGFVWTCPKCSNVYVAPWINECLKCNTKNKPVKYESPRTTG